MKKTLALVLALALVFSTVTVAFAEEPATVGADAKVCTDLGMLVGDGSGVTPAYLATNPTRIQAAVMVLRLRGLEAEAKAYTGDVNFADADKAAWAKPIMGYLKAHPELGWLGDGTNFNPTANITAKEYYKNMLETLGYKQNTAEVVGDFTWENVVEFATGKGLANAAATTFTVNDLAVATVETLKANVKDGGKTLVASLVEAGKVDQAKAEAAGVYQTTVAANAELKSVKAVANNKLAVEFTADVDKAFAEKATNFSVVTKGSTTALEVKSSVLEASNKVVVETAAQTAGAAYTLTVGSKSMNFDGLGKDSGVPKVDKVECSDTNTIKVTYTKMMDFDSATNVANYTLNNGATVKAAKLSSGRTQVTLTTEGIAAHKVYNLKIENVLSADLVALKTATESVRGIVDDNAPEVDKVEFDDNNSRLTVIFEKGDDEHGISEESAKNLDNFAVTAGSDTLAIKSLVPYYGATDDNDYIDRVEINTDPMVKGTEYTLTVKDIVDGSVSANKMEKSYTKKFRGKAADDDAPEITSAAFISDTVMMVAFKDANRLDVASATDAANYEVSDSIAVKEVKLLDNSYPYDTDDDKTVLLTTSSVDDTKRYTLTVNNVADEFGNVIKANSSKKNIHGIIEDVVPPYVKSVVSNDTDNVVLTFDESDANMLNKATAEDPTNYEISGITVKKAELGDDRHTVTLTTSEMEAAKEYKVIISNVSDIIGNVMSSSTVKVIAYNGMDNKRPEISEISVEARNLVKVTFNEKVQGTGTMIVEEEDANGEFQGATSGSDTTTLTAVGNPMDDETAILFRTTSPAKFTQDKSYVINSIAGITDTHNNSYVVEKDVADRDTIDADTSVNEGPAVDSIEQTGAKEITVTFDEPILLYQSSAYYNDVDTDTTPIHYTSEAVDSDLGIDLGGQGFDAYIDYVDDNDDAGWSTLTLKFGSTIDSDKTLGLNFSSFVSDYAGAPAIDEDDNFDEDTMTAGDAWTNYQAGFVEDVPTLFDTYFEDEDGPEVVDVRAKNQNTIEVVYDEDIDNTSTHRGSYSVVDDEDNKLSVSGTAIGDEDYIVNVSVASMTASKSYTLTINGSAYDLTGNKNKDLEGEDFDFVGSSIQVYNYVKGVEVVDARTLKVKLSKSVTQAQADAATVKLNNAGADLVNGSATLVAAVAGKSSTFTVTLTQPLLDGKKYTVGGLNVTGLNIDAYTFTADIDSGDLGVDVTKTGSTITSAIVTFSDPDVTSYVVRVVYEGGTYTVTPIDTDSDGVYDKFDLENATDDWTFVPGSGTDNGYTKLSEIADDASYVVEVYRAEGSILVDTADPGFTSYAAAVTAAGVDAAPVYTDVFTK